MLMHASSKGKKCAHGEAHRISNDMVGTKIAFQRGKEKSCGD